MFERRDDGSDLWVGANWSINSHEARHPWKGLDWLPLIYLGEFDVQSTVNDNDRNFVGLTAFHEFHIVIIEGLFAQLRYDWRDKDLKLKDDELDRYTVGVVAHPFTHFEVITQFRVNVETPGVRNNEFFVQVHGWF